MWHTDLEILKEEQSGTWGRNTINLFGGGGRNINEL